MALVVSTSPGCYKDQEIELKNYAILSPTFSNVARSPMHRSTK
jgi:hypothetical protein